MVLCGLPLSSDLSHQQDTTAAANCMFSEMVVHENPSRPAVSDTPPSLSNGPHLDAPKVVAILAN